MPSNLTVPLDDEKLRPISSSRPPVFAADQESLFREVIELMTLNRIQFAISGAFALHEHTGIWRDTKDLDFFMPAQEAARALKVLENMGLATEIADPVWLAKARRGDYYVDLITGMSNAVVRVDYCWIKRANLSQVLGLPVRVLAPEELIASKIFVAFRERFDGADICHVVFGTKGRLDWQRLLHLIGEHWEMLLWCLVLYQYAYPAYGGYVPRAIWDELLQRFRVELEHPNQGIQFRGNLIDDKMFAIDVTEWGKRDILKEYRETAEMIEPKSEKAA
ncbi:MAG TPA: nucleotidyltransferase [Candidatus Solibacter sp.]|nr:nucleotidyltransferase [Candidatus Solibacter sp.]